LTNDEQQRSSAVNKKFFDRFFWKTLGNLEHSVRTASPALEIVEPAGIWAYFESHPAEAQVFGEAMTAKASADIAAVLGA
jgi:hypothetical protein